MFAVLSLGAVAALLGGALTTEGRPTNNPESERAAKEVLSLPIYPELASAQLDEVVAAVRAFYGR